jgi:hypothetical protein
MYLGVDTGDINIGEGFKLLEKFYDLFKQDATAMEDADDLADAVTTFQSHKDESAQVLVARFEALTTKLKLKSATMKFPDKFLLSRFLRALPTPRASGTTLMFWTDTTEVNSPTWPHFRRPF